MDTPQPEITTPSQPSTPAVNPVEPKKSKKGIWIILGIAFVIIVFLVGVGGYYVGNMNKSPIAVNISPNPSPVITEAPEATEPTQEVIEKSGFSDYLSKTIPKVSFSYPSGDEWKVSDSKVANMDGYLSDVSVKYDAKTCGPNCGLAFHIGTYEKNSSEAPESNYGEVQFANNSTYKLNSKEAVNFGNVKGTRWEFAPSASDIDSVIYYYLADENYIYAIGINVNGAKGEVDFTKIGDEIAKSLKFNQ